MITAEITAKVKCSTTEEVTAAKEKLIESGFKVFSTLDPKVFNATMTQVLNTKEEL